MGARAVWEITLLFVCTAINLRSCSASERKLLEKYKVEFGMIREGHTYNDPSKLITSTPEECCKLCMEEDRCKSWTRERSTGGCAFKPFVVEIRRNENFDTGVLGGVEAMVDPPLDDRCIVEGEVDFMGGDLDVNAAVQTRNAQECCRMCENEPVCFSWTRVRSTGACFLKGSVPDRVENQDTDGGTIF